MLRPTRLLTIFFTLLVLASPSRAADAPPAADPDEIVSSMTVPEGLEVTVWARSPLFFNPTRIDCDERGRIWVAEAVDYRGFNTRKGKLAPVWHEEGDRIMILEDTDGDGKADASKIFVQDKDLVAPLGVAVIGDKVVVSCSPNLIVYTRDMKTDAVLKKEFLLTGFGGFDHDHSLHKVQAGPDGKWYFNTGNAGPHIVKDKSGWELRSGSWYTGGTPYNKTNTPGLKSDDGRVWSGGLILCVNPDGTGLTVLGQGHRNPYGTCIDSFGDMWGDDNDDTQSCRTTWLMKYADLGYSSKDGTRSWQADKRPGQSIPTAHWRQEDPGVIPSGHVYGNGSPTGICYYEGGALGDKYAGGLLLECEAGQNVVWGYLRKPKGAGFEMEAFPFLRSTANQDPNYVWNKKEEDRRKWFRPSDVIVGTDGCIYVCDWFDQIVGGHQMQDPAGKGFIYRIGPKGFKAGAPKYKASTIAGAIELLKSPAVNVREVGRARLAATQGAQREQAKLAIHKMWDDGTSRFEIARAAWLMAEFGQTDDMVFPLKSLSDWERRVVAFRAVWPVVKNPRNVAIFASASVPPLAREVALAVRDWPIENSADILTNIAMDYDGKDRWYLEALGTGCEGKEEAMYAILLGKLGNRPLKWSDAFADIAWRLHPVTSVMAHRDRALSAEISVERRHQAIDAIAFINDNLAASAMNEIASKGPEDLRTYAQWWLDNRAANDWKDYGIKTSGAVAGKGGKGGKGGLAAETGVELFASPVLKKGGVDIDVDITDAKQLILIADDGGDGVSSDWADWVNGVLIGPAGQTKLTDLKWESAANGWLTIQINKNVKEMPLRIDGVTYENGIGGHAKMRLVYDIADKGFTRFKCRAGVDNGGPDLGGSDYKGGTASVRFHVYIDGPSPRDKAMALRKKLLDPLLKPAERESAAIAMATSAEGGKILLNMAEEKTLPDSLKSAVAVNIGRNPDLAVRAMAGNYFPRATPTGQPYPSLDELMKLSGDPAHGKTVYLTQTATCTACHRIGDQGRDVGPDLTKIGAKYDRRAMFDQILNPSASILSGYEAYLIETKDGDSFTGFIVADGETLILKDTLGQQQSIPKKDIASRRQLELSIMPNDVALGLKPQELADLVSYLEAQK